MASINQKWSLSPSPESTEHILLNEAYGHFINGKFTKPENTFPSINPASEEHLASVSQASKRNIDRAVQAARSAFNNEWSALAPSQRAKYIYRIARMIQERAKEFAVIESLDGGKPIRESRDIDIPLAAAHFFYHAGWADKLQYAFPNSNPKPLGVVGQIIPWNFPLLMAAWKIAPALACGNTVVLKPAETTSLTALKLAELLNDCDLPDGVVNIITGDGRVGEALVNHPDINKIAFTGSTQVGKRISRATAGTEKKLTLELGGKAAHIIFEDAAIDQAVEGIVNGIYFNQGHVCCAGSRLFVQESVAQEVLKKLEHRIESLIVGDPLDKNTDVGAINSQGQLKTIASYIDQAKKEGIDYFESSSDLPNKGFWCKPIIFKNVAQSNRLSREEIFGPVLAVQTFRTTDEVIDKANNTPYGLSAGVWTSKGSRIFNLTSNMKAGVVWANTYNKFDPTSPFGGYKESGFGREGGVHGLGAYLSFD